MPLSIIALRAANRSATAAEGSRLEAKRSADVATEALTESRRAADAAERQAVAAEALLPKPPPPIKWQLELLKAGRHGSASYALRNIGTETATGVKIDQERAKAIARVEFDGDPGVVVPGATVQFWVLPTMGNPKPTEAWLTWDGVDEEIPVPLT